MNKTESARYIEEVQGQIIGDYWLTGQLFHKGRPQGPRFNGANDDELKAEARKVIENLKERLGTEYARLYPSGLELRIWS